MLALDIDNFKYINDTLGHKAGDEVITRVARNIRERMRETDTLARLGGDEFAILLPEAGIEQAQSVARTIIDTVRVHPVSVGGPADPGHHQHRHDDLRQPRGGRRGAARRGRPGDVRREGRRPRPVRPLHADGGARGARSSRGSPGSAGSAARSTSSCSSLYCQPIVSIATGEPVQYELLLRMVDDEAELVLPGSFVPSAERFGLMPAVDRWVMHQAVRLLRERRSRGCGSR